MTRAPRYYVANRPYELCFRTKRGLPFPPWETMKLVLTSALARSNRGERVTICHYLWMANHLHIILVSKDANDLVLFYMELQKKITEYIKRLTGISHLTLWEDRPIAASIEDPDEMIKRIAYLYANPARAGLVSSIEDYPHLSSWKEDQQADTVNANTTINVPRVLFTHVPMVPNSRMSPKQDRAIYELIKEQATKLQPLTIHPNAWMKCFRMKDISAMKSKVSKALAAHEQDADSKRKYPVIGAPALFYEGIRWDHIPKKRDRKIFVLASTPELRIYVIKKMQQLRNLCATLYEKLKKGINVTYPPGMFKPWVPPNANALC